jgi:glycosyltransferase involved in cell wall biosynthesis
MNLTKKDKKLIHEFNKPDTHLVISRWPGRGKGARFDGIAAYTKEIVTSFASTKKASFIVLAEKIDGEPLLTIPNNRVLVIRAFNPNHHSLFPSILTWLLEFNTIRTVVVHSDFCASTGPQFQFLLIPFLLLIRLTGRSITYYAHNVVSSLEGMGEHLNITGWKQPLFSFALRWYYRLLGLVVSRFVALEKIVYNRLKKILPFAQMSLEPIWIQDKNLALSKLEARKQLGLPLKKKIVISFGFVTYYKGADWVVSLAEEARRLQNQRLYFVLAGGEAYSLKDKVYYRTYLHSLVNRVSHLPNISISGFIPDSQIKLWMTAADLVIFPYRGLIGGSASLALASAYRKPLMVSRPMYQALKYGLFADAMKDSRAHVSNVVFPLAIKERKKVIELLSDSENNEDVQNVSLSLHNFQNKSVLLEQHYQEVYEANKPTEWGKQAVYAPVFSNHT